MSLACALESKTLDESIPLNMQHVPSHNKLAMYSMSNQMPALNFDASSVRVKVCDKISKDNGRLIM